MAKHSKTKARAVKMPVMKMPMRLGVAALPKGQVYLRDANDRFFTIEADGINLELKAGVLTAVDKKVADFLKGKYPYLEVVKK